jgi:glycosyltransferase involved in cell wall biosynthesis
VKTVNATNDEREQLRAVAAELQDLGVRTIHVLAWRDLHDPEAGGSELHADECMRRWSEAGLHVVHRTSAAAGHPPTAHRHGYQVIRRGSRHTVFPRVIVSELTRRMGKADAVVEIWNGVPWLSPIWFRGPNVTVLHHVHGEMWDQIFRPALARFGRALESRFAPPFYRRTAIVTACHGTRQDIHEDLGIPLEQISVIPHGVDPFWSPGCAKAQRPTVVVCGRLAPVKRHELMLESAARARQQIADLRVVMPGDGPLREQLQDWIDRNDAGSWAHLAGSVSREELREMYRSAWVVASASLAEGWGLTLTEAAACGTPAVATDISGHRCSVADGVTGRLARETELAEALVEILSDHELRASMGAAARARAVQLTWDAAALGLLRVLLAEAHRTRR